MDESDGDQLKIPIFIMYPIVSSRSSVVIVKDYLRSTCKSCCSLAVFMLMFSISQSGLASGIGGYSGTSNRLTSDPLAAGTGGITLFQNSSTNSYSQNPAAQAWSEKRRFNAGLVQLSLDRFIYSVSGSVPMPPTANLSLGLIAAGTNNIEARDSRGFSAGNLSDTEMTYLLSFSNRFSSKLAFGLSLKLITKQLSADEDWLDLKGSGFGAGLGLVYKPWATGTFALAVKDWNSGYTWKTQDLFAQGSNYQDGFPMSLAWGWLQEFGRTSMAIEHDYYFVGEHIVRAAVMWTGIKNLSLNTGLSYEDETVFSGISTRYVMSWDQASPMHIDLGFRSGVRGEGLRTYLGWGVTF